MRPEGCTFGGLDHWCSAAAQCAFAIDSSGLEGQAVALERLHRLADVGARSRFHQEGFQDL